VDRPPRLYGPLPEIEDQWPQGPPREQLWWFFRVAHRDNNQVLHSAALGRSGGVSRTTDSLGLDAGPSDRDLDRGSAPCGATSRCSPLLWDHFAIPGRDALDEIARNASDAFETGEPS
jgi:hypothetical protein